MAPSNPTAEGVFEGCTSSADSIEAVMLKRRRLELLRKKVDLVKSFGLKYYQPHQKQAEFHLAGATKRFRMVRSGNRFGKSTMGVGEDCAWGLGYRPWLSESDPSCRAGIPQRPVRGLIITTDWETVDDVFTGNRGTQGKFWSFLPKEGPGAVKSALRNHSGSIDTIELNNGSMFKFATVKSYMTNPQGIESKDWDFIHVDEPCPEGMYKGAARGLMDRAGCAWFTLTPLREPWINDFFFPQDAKAQDNVWAIDGSTYDNPYLTREAIEDFERTLTDEEKQCRIHGIPLHLAGLVYKEFSLQRHVLKDLPHGWATWLQPPREYSIYLTIDPHPQTPHAVLFCAVSPFGQHFYYTDIFLRCTIGELCHAIRDRLDGRVPVRVRIDPLAYINDPITGSNMADEFAKYGFITEKATKALEHGILKVKQSLKADPQFLYFTPECRRSIWEIQRYCWDEKDNRPVDRDDHMMENLYRCELEEPFWVDPITPPNNSTEESFTGRDLEQDERLDLSLA